MSVPRVILVCCEGGRTEPQYIRSVVKQRRINQGRAKIYVHGDRGQHLKLVDNTASLRAERGRELSLSEDDIEAWAVCDKDVMSCTLDELERRAANKNVRLAFTDPCFEVFLLQHFGFHSTNATGRTLNQLLSKTLRDRGLARAYDKSNLDWVYEMLDQEPLLLEQAITNANRLNDRSRTPYTTIQDLLVRLIEITP